MRVVHGNLLSSSAQYICHQVSVPGGMGSGVAKQITEKWPVVFSKYQMALQKYNDRLRGNVQCVRVSGCQAVATLFADSKNDLFRTFSTLNQHVSIGETIAMPYRIGCGAYGDWGVIMDMLSDVFKDKYLKLYKETKTV